MNENSRKIIDWNVVNIMLECTTDDIMGTQISVEGGGTHPDPLAILL